MWIIIPRNNIVSLVKQYCFTWQTQVFDDSNNIVSSSEVKSSDGEMLVLWKGYIISRTFTPRMFQRMMIWNVLFWGVNCRLWNQLAPAMWLLCFFLLWHVYLFRQSVFCETPEKACFTHELLLRGEREHSGGLRLTFWQIDKYYCPLNFRVQQKN